MKKIIEKFKRHSAWISAVTIIIISTIFFLTIPFQNELIEEETLKKVYYVDNISDAHQLIIDRFNEKYKEKIEVIPVNLPFNKFTTNDRKAVLTRSLRNRSDGIDIFAVDLIWISRFSKWCLPLEDHIDYSIISKFNEVALEACYQNNNLVAFPLFFDIGVLFYRKDLINKLENGAQIEENIQNSLTWKEFIDLGNKFKNEPNPYYIFPGGDFEGMVCNFHERITRKQSEKLFNNKNFDLTSESSKRALQQMVDFIYKYNFTPPEVTGFDEFSAFMTGYDQDAVFLRGWVGFPKHYKKFLDDTTKIKNMKIAPLPHYEGDNTSSVFGGWNLMISKFSDKKEEALEFIRFLFRKENQITLYEKGGYLPVNSEVYADSSFMKRNPELKIIIEILSWSKHRPFLRNYTQISEILASNFHRALRKEISVDEALSKANFEISKKNMLK